MSFDMRHHVMFCDGKCNALYRYSVEDYVICVKYFQAGLNIKCMLYF